MLYLDEDVAVVLAPMLDARGYPATTTVTAGRTGSTDRDQLLFASERGLLLVTHNVADFAALASAFTAEGRHHSGMILCARRPPRALAERISAALHRLADGSRRDLVLFA
jgi:predicted nuclease of predicted toxin-antitoxin system